MRPLRGLTQDDNVLRHPATILSNAFFCQRFRAMDPPAGEAQRSFKSMDRGSAGLSPDGT